MIASPESGAAKVCAVRVGGVAPLGPQRVPSGYRKYPAATPLPVSELGLAGDAQADLTVHGGIDKAVYGYPLSRYPDWTAAFPALAGDLVPGAMGENLVISGVDETGIHVGDRIRVGGALLQVSQPRQPCFKLGLALGEPRLAKAMVRNGWCGWYYRVLEPGVIGARDNHLVVERPNPRWPMARFAEVIAARAMGANVLAELVAMDGLAEQWRMKALQQLARLRGVGP